MDQVKSKWLKLGVNGGVLAEKAKEQRGIYNPQSVLLTNLKFGRCHT